jgi:hypothetical protein
MGLFCSFRPLHLPQFPSLSLFWQLYFPFYTALTYVVIVGVEYFEIIPSVKAITARSLGTLSPIY